VCGMRLGPFAVACARGACFWRADALGMSAAQERGGARVCDAACGRVSRGGRGGSALPGCLRLLRPKRGCVRNLPRRAPPAPHACAAAGRAG
jgi:hypothetical protein